MRSAATISAILAALLLWAGIPAVGADSRPANQGNLLESLWSRGEEALANGDLQRAERNFLEALTLDQENGRTWNYLGGVSFGRKDYAAALERFKRAAAASPTDARIQNNLGTVFDQIGDVTRAIEHYLTAIGLDSDYAVPHRNLGAVYAYKVKDLTLARKYWTVFLSLSSDAGERAAVREEMARLRLFP